MKLTDEQLRSSLWLALRKEYEGKLATLRRTNDSHKSELDTAALRGKIVTIKELLRLDPTWTE
jgi:hypothetical protein